MKRFISLLIAVGIAAGALLFAETGYNGLQWWTKKNRIDFSNREVKIESGNKELTELIETCVIINKPILGKLNYVYYIFPEGELSGITYTIPVGKTQELKKKFSDVSKIIKANPIKPEEIKSLLDNEYGENQDNSIYNLLLNIVFYGLTVRIENGEVESEKDAGAQINIYDYNDDTRVYIYENLIEGETVVVYVPHERDY